MKRRSHRLRREELETVTASHLLLESTSFGEAREEAQSQVEKRGA